MFCMPIAPQVQHEDASENSVPQCVTVGDVQVTLQKAAPLHCFHDPAVYRSPTDPGTC